jgi:hypothetical protein
VTDREHLLARCLRLEERVHALECQLRRAGLTPRRLVTAAEAALMCDLRARGVPKVTISACTGWSLPTVERHTKKGAL